MDVMVFGVFDGVHEGHRFLFREAKRHGDRLIAVVTQDQIVETLKGKLPRKNLSERVADLEKEEGIGVVAIGDLELGSWGVIFKYKPPVIALGYDQIALEKNLRENLEKGKFDWQPKIVLIGAHKPEIYHNSLLPEHL